MRKIFKLILIFLISSCSNSALSVDKIDPKLETMSFDVVQKNLEIKGTLPNNIQNLLNNWFDDKVKINGFDGSMHFTVYDYQQITTLISDGKRIDISLKFIVIIKKPSLEQKKLIEGEVASYGTLTGTFNLNEFDTLIQNTQIDLITRLSRDLRSKI